MTMNFYSATRRGIESLNIKAAAASVWQSALLGLIRAGQAKVDELEWSGLTSWLEAQTSRVSKEDVLEILDLKGVRVKETVLSDNGDSSIPLGWGVRRSNENDDAESPWVLVDENGEIRGEGATEGEAILDGQDIDEAADIPTKYRQYTLPGGANYREVLLLLPNFGGAKKIPVKLDWVQSTDAMLTAELPTGNLITIVYDPESPDDGASLQVLTPDAIDVGQERDFPNLDAAKAAAAGMVDAKLQNIQGGFRSKHWTVPNVLAHFRVTDRMDAKGSRVLFVEELQSDWHASAREKGFDGDCLDIGYSLVEQEPGFYHLRRDGASYPIAYGQRETVMSVARERGLIVEGVPRAPFVDKLDKWLALSLKRIMMMAVDGGYEAVAFVNGEQSALRYRLGKHLDSIEYKLLSSGRYVIGGRCAGSRESISITNGEGVDADRLAKLVGKDIASQIVAGEGKEGRGPSWKELADLDVKVGGEGIKVFYNKIVPAAVKDLLRTVGESQMTTVEIQTPQHHNFMPPAVRGPAWKQGFDKHEQCGFFITKEMRELISSKGLPLF